MKQYAALSGGLDTEQYAMVAPGSVFGLWTVLEPDPHRRHGRVLCRCVCGTERRVLVDNLIRGLSRSCGCMTRVAPGMARGDLTVTGSPWKDAKGRRRVRCRCSCGRIFFPRIDDLLAGKTQSCGCRHFTPEFRQRMRVKAGFKAPVYHVQTDLSEGFQKSQCPVSPQAVPDR